MSDTKKQVAAAAKMVRSELQDGNLGQINSVLNQILQLIILLAEAEDNDAEAIDKAKLLLERNGYMVRQK